MKIKQVNIFFASQEYLTKKKTLMGLFYFENLEIILSSQEFFNPIASSI